MATLALKATAIATLLAQQTIELAAKSRIADAVAQAIAAGEAKAKEKKSGTHSKVKQVGNTDGRSAGSKVVTLGLILPEQGTLGPQGFLKAMTSAGRRPFEVQQEDGTKKTVIRVAPQMVRDDQIRAIAAYCGWDHTKLFGEQEVMARAKASREIKGETGGLTLQERRERNRSLVGYIAGLPDHVQRSLDNLLAQERETADKVADMYRDCPNADQRTAVWIQGVMIEEERLAHIRQQMADLVTR
jgi:hypothetical protein